MTSKPDADDASGGCRRCRRALADTNTDNSLCRVCVLATVLDELEAGVRAGSDEDGIEPESDDDDEDGLCTLGNECPQCHELHPFGHGQYCNDCLMGVVRRRGAATLLACTPETDSSDDEAGVGARRRNTARSSLNRRVSGVTT